MKKQFLVITLLLASSNAIIESAVLQESELDKASTSYTSEEIKPSFGQKVGGELGPNIAFALGYMQGFAAENIRGAPPRFLGACNKDILDILRLLKSFCLTGVFNHQTYEPRTM